MRREIIARINLGESVHIKAKPGLGATTLLKGLPGVYVEPYPLKPIVTALAGVSKGGMVELKKLIDYDQVLLIDDVQEVTKQVRIFVIKAMNQGLVVVSAGTRNIFGLPELVLKPLSFDESVRLVNKHLHNKELSRVIASEVGGSPALLMKAVRKALARNDLKTLQGFSEFKKSLNALIKRKELISLGLIVSLYPLVQTLRHLFYAQREYQLGHWMATIAYSLMLIKSIKRK